MRTLGKPAKPVTTAQIKALALCTAEERSVLLRKWRQAEWARRARAANPELHLQRARDNRKRLVAMGYYRKGGKGASHTRTSEKRRAYYRWYNANVRANRSHV